MDGEAAGFTIFGVAMVVAVIILGLRCQRIEGEDDQARLKLRQTCIERGNKPDECARLP